MGYSYTREDLIHARSAAAIKGADTKARKKLADRIVNVCIDMTVNQIIRPGPKPEERECYEMANELRAIKDQMVELITEILRISEEED
jgi:hypothetical protein